MILSVSGVPSSGASLPAGAYGLRIEGLAAPPLLAPVPASWTLVQLEKRGLDGDAPQTTRIDGDVAELAFESGWSVRVHRMEQTATFYLPDSAGDDELVHPCLGPAAAQFASWLGHDVLHAGAFLGSDGGAWAVLADRGGGKSTTLAHLAGHGVPVLADDLLVLDGGNALAAPRCIDLRPTAAVLFGDTLDEVRHGERRRLTLPAITTSSALRGFFVLEWGETVELEPIPPSERVAELGRHCKPATGSALLELSALPVWRVRRPADVDSLSEVGQRMLETAVG